MLDHRTFSLIIPAFACTARSSQKLRAVELLDWNNESSKPVVNGGVFPSATPGKPNAVVIARTAHRYPFNWRPRFTLLHTRREPDS
jgi:hypothetical protein